MPSIQSTGGIFLRLDSSGNLNIYNTSGTSIAKFLTGNLSTTGNKGTFVSGLSPITSTTSLTTVTVGQSVQIAPQIATTVLVFAYIDAAGTNTNTDGGSLQIVRATGTLNPTGGVAPDAGPIVAANDTNFATAAGDKRTISLFALDTGLTAGTAYTYELVVKALVGGTFSWSLGGIATIGAFEL